MRSNAIIRIVLFSLAIILLLGILAGGLGLGMFMFHFDIGNGNYISGGSAVPANEITQIEIEWASGAINIITNDDDSITFSETGIADEDREMVYSIDNGKLTICFSKPSVQIGFFSSADKELTVSVPEAWVCQELKVESASADITVSGICADKVEFENASGKCDFDHCRILELTVETASGNIHYEGTLDEFSCDAASADVSAILQNIPRSINMESVSGDLELTLPKECGFSATLDGISGSFQSEFSTITKNNKYIYGDGTCKIELECVSGDVRIFELK